MTVLTTSNVPQQARACNLPTLAFLLPIACRRVTHGQRTLPPELVQVILSHVRKNANMEFGMSREDAERRRRELMSDRKVQTQDINGVSSANVVRSSALIWRADTFCHSYGRPNTLCVNTEYCLSVSLSYGCDSMSCCMAIILSKTHVRMLETLCGGRILEE
jgi:hypothetical protein